MRSPRTPAPLPRRSDGWRSTTCSPHTGCGAIGSATGGCARSRSLRASDELERVGVAAVALAVAAGHHVLDVRVAGHARGDDVAAAGHPAGVVEVDDRVLFAAARDRRLPEGLERVRVG